MNKKKTIISMLVVFLMIMTSFGVIASTTSTENRTQEELTTDLNFVEKFDVFSTLSEYLPSAIAVSDSDPFYALIATPLGVHYNDVGEQEFIPFYIKNFDNPSKAVERAEEQIGIYANYIIDGIFSPKETSLFVANMFWEKSNTTRL